MMDPFNHEDIPKVYYRKMGKYPSPAFVTVELYQGTSYLNPRHEQIVKFLQLQRNGKDMEKKQKTFK